MEVFKDNTTLIDKLNNANNKCWSFHTMEIPISIKMINEGSVIFESFHCYSEYILQYRSFI